jgi:hypothetical protein
MWNGEMMAWANSIQHFGEQSHSHTGYLSQSWWVPGTITNVGRHCSQNCGGFVSKRCLMICISNRWYWWFVSWSFWWFWSPLSTRKVGRRLQGLHIQWSGMTRNGHPDFMDEHLSRPQSPSWDRLRKPPRPSDMRLLSFLNLDGCSEKLNSTRT